MRLPVLYLSKSYVSVLLGTVVFLLLSITRLSAQPANDSCLQALQIFPPLLVGQSYSYQGHNIGANPELGSGIFDDCTPGGLFSGFGADVWYRFIAPGDVCMSITINGLAEPQINVIEAGTCFSGLEILCTSGSAGTVTGSVELQAGQSYLLRVSGGSQSDQGSFNISLTGITCDAEDLDPYDPCLVADKLELSPLPGQGNTYQPGQEVTMCYTVSGWQYEEQNWLHAISLDIGPGWDLSSLQPQFDFICNSNPNGQWNWYDFWISCTTGNLFGPGFAFESFVQGSCPYGNQFDDDPGTNWGDIGPGCSVAENDPSWKFCWTITVADCSDNENTDLSIGITALSDGASGSWDFPVCGFEVDETIMLKADCSEFNCMPMIAIVEGQSVSCFNEMDGSFDVYPFSSPNETYNVYLYTLEDILLDAAIGVSLPYSYPSVLDTGYYGILVELPGAQEQGYCNEGVIDIIHIQPAFDIFISTTHNCSPDSVQLRASTWPNQSVISYEWSGPNGFTSTDAQPYITQEGTYHVSVSTANCTREASMYIELPDQYISLLIDYWLNVPCADNRLYLYTSDANDNINSYQWTDNATGNALSPSASPIPGSLLWDFGVISSDLDLSLVVISDQGCTDTLFFTVEYYEAPPLNYESSITACQNNDVEINLVENPEIAQVLWLDNNSYESPRIFSNLSPGEILKVPVLITYSNTCEIQDTVSITAPGVNITASDTIACIGNTITIESSPANSYLWSTGETSPSITFTPTTGGDYSFAVTVTDMYDCQRTDNIVINVPNLAEASFTYQVNGNTVFFQPLIPEAIEDTYTWNFGDNTSSSEYAPFHTYSGQDSVVIEFIVNTRCGTDVETQTIYFNLPPTANFTGHLNAGCAPLSVIFNNESTNAIAYFWEFPGGTPATSMAVNPTVTYMEAGVYSVSLFVYNQNGFAFLNENDYIVVGAPPTGSFDFTADFLTVDFIATTEDADSLSWDFGDGNSSSLSNPQHVYPAEGQYEVVLTLFNECGSTQVNQLITVEQLLPPLVSFSAQGDTEGCAPISITFINQSSGADNYLWNFPGGNPASSTEVNPTVVYEQPGIFNVELIAFNAAGSSALVGSEFVTVGAPPTGSFDFTTDFLTVDFMATTENTDSLIWDFGDGNSSSLSNPQHVYPAEGQYEVVLTLFNECGSVQVNQLVTVEQLLPPLVSFSAQGDTEGCAPISITFINQSSGADNYLWNFPGGNPASSTEVNPTVVYEQPGIFNVELIAFNAAGSSALVGSEFVSVGAPPTGSFDFTTDFLTVDFMATTENADSLIWDFGDGNSSSLSNPQHVYPAEGQYEVVLTLFNECGSVQVNQLVTVEQLLPPLVSFSAQGDTEGCAPISITFINQSSGADNYLWNFPGGNPASSTEVNPTVVYEQPGIFNVELIAFNAAGSSALVGSEFVTVGAPPTGSFDFTTDFLTVDFMATTENADSLIWDFGDGNSSSLSNPQHVYPAEGQYEVVLTLFNECGSVQVNQLVTVEQLLPPLVSFSAQGDTEGCAPISITFINQSSGADNYLWNFPGGNPASSTEVNPTVVYEQPGIFNVELIAFNAAGSSALVGSEFVSVGAPPTGSFDFTTDFLTVDFMATTENADSLIWDFGDGNSSSFSNPQHVYPAEGQYEVVLTLFNECGTYEITETLNLVISGTSSMREGNSWKIYPNPNNGQFWIVSSPCGDNKISQLIIWNSIGALVHQKTYTLPEQSCQTTINLATSAGIYWIYVIDTTGQAFFEKVIIY